MVDPRPQALFPAKNGSNNAGKQLMWLGIKLAITLANKTTAGARSANRFEGFKV